MGRLRPPLRLVCRRFGGWTPGLGFGSPTLTYNSNNCNRSTYNSSRTSNSSYSTTTKEEEEKTDRGRRRGMLGARAKGRSRCMGNRRRWR